MIVKSKKIKLQTKGKEQVVNVTDEVKQAVAEASVKEGLVTVFIYGSTASVTTIENASYSHEQTWGEDNSNAHLNASLIGPSLTVPIIEGAITLGTWQQIVVIDHDNRSRGREVVIQIVGE
ncbi:MAG: secondary thiamine-phosphate synthase enzyme YjbQ [Candidatus Margulisiibacteriota bacterium]